MKQKLISLCLLPILAFAQWEIDFDEDFAAAPAAASSWWTGIGLTAVWPMDEGSGSNITDRIGSLHGTAFGSIVWESSLGSTFLSFDGVTNYVSFGDVCDVASNSFLAACWVKARSTVSQYTGLFTKDNNGAGSGRYAIGASDSAKLRTYMTTNGAQLASINTTTAVPTSWTHLCMCVENETLYFFIDGVLTGTPVACPINVPFNNSSPLVLGTAIISGRPFYTFGGWMADIAIKQGGGTSDVSRIYNATKARYRK